MAEKINALDLLKDFRSGVDDWGLMAKYGLDQTGLESEFKKLIKIGLLDLGEYEVHRPILKVTPGGKYVCPACEFTQVARFTECPKCGIFLTTMDDSTAFERAAIEEALAERISPVTEEGPKYKPLTVKKEKSAQDEFSEGVSHLFLGLIVASGGFLLAALFLPNPIGLATPLVLGLMAYFSGCFHISRGKGYNSIDGIILGIIFIIGPFLLLIRSDKRTGESSLGISLVYLLFLVAVGIIAALAVAILTGEFLI